MWKWSNTWTGWTQAQEQSPCVTVRAVTFDPGDDESLCEVLSTDDDFKLSSTGNGHLLKPEEGIGARKQHVGRPGLG